MKFNFNPTVWPLSAPCLPDSTPLPSWCPLPPCQLSAQLCQNCPPAIWALCPPAQPSRPSLPRRIPALAGMRAAECGVLAGDPAPFHSPTPSRTDGAPVRRVWRSASPPGEAAACAVRPSLFSCLVWDHSFMAVCIVQEWRDEGWDGRSWEVGRKKGQKAWAGVP